MTENRHSFRHDAPFRTVARPVIAWLASLLRALAHRGEVRRLLELDERQLKDIGLTRNDVLGALAEPVGIDPSRSLPGGAIDRSRLRGLPPGSRRVTVLQVRTA